MECSGFGNHAVNTFYNDNITFGLVGFLIRFVLAIQGSLNYVELDEMRMLHAMIMIM